MSCITRIINAAPALRILGVDDHSGGQIPIPERQIPQMCPLWIFQSAKGPLGHRLTSPNEMSLVYGKDVLTLTSPYANHQTLGMQRAMEKGNIGVTYRVSNGERANLSLGVDIATAVLDNYERHPDGRIKIGNNGVPVINQAQPTVNGYSVKIIQRSRIITNTNQLGSLVPNNGVQTNLDGSPSTYFPLIEMIQNDPGAGGNNNGIMLYSPRADQIDVNEAHRLKSFPYVFAMIERDNSYDSGGIITTKLDETVIEVHLDPNAKSRYDDSTLYFPDIVRERYNNTTDRDLPLRIAPFDKYIFSYEDNIDTVLKMLYQRERDFVDANPNIISAQPLDQITQYGNEQYLFNLFGGYDTSGVPYYTMSYDAQGAVSTGILLTNATKIWAGNGTDKLMSVTEYEREVRKIIKNYGDCRMQEQDLATHPENWFIDTGFGFETKKFLKEFISQRPDTILVLGTHYDTTDVKGYIKPATLPTPLPPDWVEPEVSSLTPSEEIQIGGILESECRSKPESTYFGTSAMRAVIFVNSAKTDASGWNRRVNYSHYLIPRAAERFGQGNERWKAGAGFSAAPGSVIRHLTDTSVRWINYGRRVAYWKKSLNFPLSYDYDYDFMPAIQTIYDDDSSTLNALPNVQMITHLWTIAYRAWREFSGTDNKSENELAIAIVAFVLDQLRGKFDDNYNINVEVYFTKQDKQRHYSWTLLYQVEQGTMYTVESVIIETYRFNQLNAAGAIRA